jgi:hypothetical protein
MAYYRNDEQTLCAFAALGEKNFHRHCEAQRAVAPNVKHALKQSKTCTALMLRLLQPRRRLM